MTKRIPVLLDQFEKELLALDLPSNPANLYEPIRYILTLGGKRIRPLLVLLGSELFGRPATNAMKAALAVEVFHNFTLLHDDIMDSADVRRKLPTVHKKWNTNIAILSGDAMLVKAYQLLAESEVDNLKQIFNEFSQTAMEVCEGQQLDMDYSTTWDISMDNYLHMISQKTAVLLAGSLRIGAMHAGADQQSMDSLKQFAINLGLAFQVQDDYLDAFGGAGFGKTPGGDIREGKRTWLTLKALELASLNQQAEIKAAYASSNLAQRVETITGLYQTLGIDSLSKSFVSDHSFAAVEHLRRIQGNEHIKSELGEMVQQLIGRGV